jgi:Cd2+/Zn2+-exporting ATPase
MPLPSSSKPAERPGTASAPGAVRPSIEIACCGCGSGARAPARPSQATAVPARARSAEHGHGRGHDHGDGDGDGRDRHDHRDHADGQRHAGDPARAQDRGASADDAHAGHDHSALPGPARLGAALALALAAEGADWWSGAASSAWRPYAGMALAAAAIALAGLGVFRSGWRSLLAGRLGIDALMAVAVTGAFLIGQWPEAAMVMALYALAERIEERSVRRARDAVSALLSLRPDEAEMQAAGGDWRTVAASEVPAGALVRVRPGGRIPLDGEVTAGRGAVDEASITGESLPVDKAPGSPLFAGTVNAQSALEFRVTAAAGDTMLDRIVRAVAQAQADRAPTQRLVDRFAAIYTPAVFVLAVAVAVGAPLLLDWRWTDAVYRALTLLVIACPCALVLSTPVTVVSALTAAARRGILVKGGAWLEEARGIRAVAFDKTGTVTAGRPVLVAQEFLPADAASDRTARQAAAALAGRSDHPVSGAIAAGLAAGTGGGEPAPAGGIAPQPEVLDFAALPGHGVRGRIGDAGWTLGNRRMMQARGLWTPALEAAAARHAGQGRSVTLLADDRAVRAVFAVADTVRPQAAEAVADLLRLGIAPVMLTGDNAAAAAAAAREAGIAEVRADLLPEDKLAAIESLRARHGMTAMAGDGINDAPALARADIGFAMGGTGTDVATETADVVIMNDDLRRIAETVRLSRRTRAVLVQNIALAVGIKLAFLGLALAGEATMWMAVFADMGASLLVVANSLRLLRAAGRPA